MKVFGKEINDECSKCGNILECELFRQGHRKNSGCNETGTYQKDSRR